MKYNFPQHKKGDTFNGVDFELLINDVAKDLTSATIKMQLKLINTANATAALTLQTGSGITITDAVNGVFRIDQQIINIAAGIYTYDIQFTFSDSTVKTYIYGEWQIKGDITQ